jgi:hypothetical protein
MHEPSIADEILDRPFLTCPQVDSSASLIAGRYPKRKALKWDEPTADKSSQ